MRLTAFVPVSYQEMALLFTIETSGQNWRSLSSDGFVQVLLSVLDKMHAYYRQTAR